MRNPKDMSPKELLEFMDDAARRVREACAEAVLKYPLDEPLPPHPLVGRAVSYYAGTGTVRAVYEEFAWVEMAPRVFNTASLRDLETGKTGND